MINIIRENIFLAFESLRANKLRSLLTTLGIIIGIMTVIAIISVIQGLNNAFSDQIFATGLGGGVLYVQKYPWASENWAKYRKYKNISFREYEAIEQNAKLISKMSPVYNTGRTVKYGSKKMELVHIAGANEDYQLIRETMPVAGRGLTRDDVQRKRNVAVIGWDIADKLFRDKNPIGERIRIGKSAFRIVGILEKRGSFFDQNLDQMVIVPWGSFLKSFGSRRSLSIMCQVADPDRMDDAKDELRVIVRRARKVPLDGEDNFAINQIDVLMDLYNKLTGSLYAAMFGVAAISLLVGGIGIMNIMLVSVVERTREIGIRKALGAKKRDILIQFLIEATVLSAIGGVLGVGAGFGVAKLVASVSPVPADVQMWSVVVGIIFSSVTGLGFGIFPAMKAAKRHPVEALSYE